MVQSLSEAASLMGKKGGASKSKRKQRSSAENGKKGGRPKTKTAAQPENSSSVR